MDRRLRLKEVVGAQRLHSGVTGSWGFDAVDDERVGYRFRVDRSDGGRLITCDDPWFQVNLGTRSYVWYTDALGEVSLASAQGQTIRMDTTHLEDLLRGVPQGLGRNEYAALVVRRIRAAAGWANQPLAVEGPLGASSSSTIN